MGWSHGIDKSRAVGDQDIGYDVQAVCDQEDCKEKIDKRNSYPHLINIVENSVLRK